MLYLNVIIVDIKVKYIYSQWHKNFASQQQNRLFSNPILSNDEGTQAFKFNILIIKFVIVLLIISPSISKHHKLINQPYLTTLYSF